MFYFKRLNNIIFLLDQERNVEPDEESPRNSNPKRREPNIREYKKSIYEKNRYEKWESLPAISSSKDQNFS